MTIFVQSRVGGKNIEKINEAPPPKFLGVWRGGVYDIGHGKNWGKGYCGQVHFWHSSTSWAGLGDLQGQNDRIQAYSVDRDT